LKPEKLLALPVQDHVSIDRKFRFIRKWKTTDAAAGDGARLREGLLDKTNTASSVWADTAYRSKANEDFMEKEGFVSKVHRKKPHLKPMPRHIQKSNAGKSVIRSRVEHVFADRKSQTGLFIRTVGISRATMRIGASSSWSGSARMHSYPAGGSPRSAQNADRKRPKEPSINTPKA
ncbi:transposase, partial [Acetobacter tropicalis]